MFGISPPLLQNKVILLVERSNSHCESNCRGSVAVQRAFCGLIKQPLDVFCSIAHKLLGSCAIMLSHKLEFVKIQEFTRQEKSNAIKKHYQ